MAGNTSSNHATPLVPAVGEAAEEAVDENTIGGWSPWSTTQVRLAPGERQPAQAASQSGECHSARWVAHRSVSFARVDQALTDRCAHDVQTVFVAQRGGRRTCVVDAPGGTPWLAGWRQDAALTWS